MAVQYTAVPETPTEIFMELLNDYPMPEGRLRHDYSALMGWQVGQCILADPADSLRIKGYFERSKQWKFTQRKQDDGRIRLWRKA